MACLARIPAQAPVPRHTPLRRRTAGVAGRVSALAAAVLLGACTSFGVIDNQPLKAGEDQPGYSLDTFNRTLNQRSDELSLAVAFSGGGTRAAALAYGVMQELRDTRIQLNGSERSLLESINVISSVSGGSFTSAYYGLYGERLFKDFEARFLRRNIEGALLRSLFNPLQWFSSHDRTETAVSYYKQNLFGEATFGDLIRKNAPLILINTSDLASGERFTFNQEYFDLLCSDLSSFSLARAVTASSAVPVVFDPVVVENFSGCVRRAPAWLTAAKRRDANDPNLAMIVRDNDVYKDKARHRYAQFVDGGITDNLGLRAMLDTIELVGGARQFQKDMGIPVPRHIAFISVNAAADTPLGIGATSRAPSIENTLNAVTNIQLHRYNVATLQQMQQSVEAWAKQLSTPERTVNPYFIRLSFESVPDGPLRRFLNEIPTSFALSDDQVDQLITTGRTLLRDNPDFQRLVASLGGTVGGKTAATPAK
jgi:NTE family protein